MVFSYSPCDYTTTYDFNTPPTDLFLSSPPISPEFTPQFDRHFSNSDLSSQLCDDFSILLNSSPELPSPPSSPVRVNSPPPPLTPDLPHYSPRVPCSSNLSAFDIDDIIPSQNSLSRIAQLKAEEARKKQVGKKATQKAAQRKVAAEVVNTLVEKTSVFKPLYYTPPPFGSSSKYSLPTQPSQQSIAWAEEIRKLEQVKNSQLSSQLTQSENHPHYLQKRILNYSAVSFLTFRRNNWCAFSRCISWNECCGNQEWEDFFILLVNVLVEKSEDSLWKKSDVKYGKLKKDCLDMPVSLIPDLFLANIELRCPLNGCKGVRILVEKCSTFIPSSEGGYGRSVYFHVAPLIEL